MKTSSHHARCAIIALVAVVGGGCSSLKQSTAKSPANNPAEPAASPAGLPHQMLEVDRVGKRYTNQATRVSPVDAHSLLVLEFRQQTKVEAEPLSQNWKDLQGALQVLNERAVEWKQLNELNVDTRDPRALDDVQRRASAAAQKAVFLLEDLEKLGVRGDKMRAVLSGRAMGHTNRFTTPYLNLAEWATNHWRELRTQAENYETLVESRSKVSVTVQAFRDSASGGKSLLHIDDWDKLPEGVYSPIDRTGLRPSEAEQKRLEMERQAANSIVTLINSAKTNQSNFKAAFQAKLKDFKTKVDAIEAELQDVRKTWKDTLLPDIITKLDELATSGTPQVKAAALNLKTNFVAINRLFARITNDVATAQRIKSTFVAPESADPVELLLGGSGLLAAVDQFISDVTGLVSFVAEGDKHMQGIRTNLAVLAVEFREQATRLATEELRTTLSQFEQRFPAEVKALVALWGIAKGSLGPAGAMDMLADADSKLTPRTLDNLVPARLDLKLAGLALGDLVTVKLHATNSVTGQLVASESYQHETAFMGLHGKPAVHLIFARALSGPSEATQWKPNVAAAVEWHYRIRDPQTGFAKFWNWLYPGAGIHLASLDQGPDSFEVGAGGEISFWDGLLTGGFGYNFSKTDDPKYFFVGVNLLNALSKAKDKFAGK